MAQAKEVDIFIDENGEIVMETMCGIVGGECEKILDALQEAMGAEEVRVVDKPEKVQKQRIISKDKQKIVNQ